MLHPWKIIKMVLVFAVPGMMANVLTASECVDADVANVTSLLHMLP